MPPTPHQPALPFAPAQTTGVTPSHAKANAYAAANRDAAERVLADPARYGGEGAALVEWARRVLERKAECR